MASAANYGCDFCPGPENILGITDLEKIGEKHLDDLLTDESVGIHAQDRRRVEENVKSDIGKLLLTFFPDAM